MADQKEVARIGRELRALDRFQAERHHAHIQLAAVVARQALLWASDTARAGYLSPTRFLAFAETLKQPHKSLHPTERRRVRA